MALSKHVLVGLLLVALLASAFAPATASGRGLSGADGLLRSQMEVGDLSLEEQEQVLRLQEDMESAKRHLLHYDPYYNKWYGGGKP